MTMPTRKPYVGGNWKMNLNRAESATLAQGVMAAAGEWDGRVDVALFVPFVYLQAVSEVLKTSGKQLRLGAQDFYPEPDGAYTGEISLAMLKDLGVSDVLVGHSERRHVIGEGDDLLNAKVKAALDQGFGVTFCIGEKLDQRERGETDEVNDQQLRAGLKDVPAEQLDKLTIAYEPVWAIGTGKTATPSDAQLAHAHIRNELGRLYSAEIAAKIRIQYGGSVKPSNAQELFAQEDIDGGLIGGASLKADDFTAIITAAC
jgi:triosephosphate isomerase